MRGRPIDAVMAHWIDEHFRDRWRSIVGQQKSSNIFRVGLFRGFVRRSGTTRAEGPHVALNTCGEPSEIELTAAHGLCYRSFAGVDDMIGLLDGELEVRLPYEPLFCV